jgi:hypothetical protein
MPDQRPLVIILCEDTQQEVFVRHWLRGKGFQKFRINKSRLAQGSGEHYVRTQYSFEVRELRRNNSYSPVGSALVVVIDADILPVAQRMEQLETELTSQAQARRQDTDAITVLIPKRNIETWIHYLRGQAVDEVTLYPKLRKANECAPDVRRLANASSDSDVLNQAPPSLQRGVEEMKRILTNAKTRRIDAGRDGRSGRDHPCRRSGGPAALSRHSLL